MTNGCGAWPLMFSIFPIISAKLKKIRRHKGTPSFFLFDGHGYPRSMKLLPCSAQPAEATEDNFAVLSEAKYQRWLQRTEIPERNLRLRLLKTTNLSTAGRAHAAFEIYEGFSARGAHKRINFYRRAAHEAGCPELLAKPRLDEFQRLIMATVTNDAKSLRDHIARDASAAGDLSPTVLQALLDERLYDQYRSRALDIVNAELGVLEAEGSALANGATPDGVAAPKGTRMTKLVGRIGPVVGGVLRKVVETVATEAAKKSVGL